MGEKEFKKWLEQLDSEISTQELDIEKLDTSANKAKISTILSRIPKKIVQKTEKIKKKVEKVEDSSKLCTGGKKNNEDKFNLEFKFKPAINKRTEEIAKKLEPSASRIFAPRSRNSFENLQIFEKTSSSMQSKNQSIKFVDVQESTKRMHDWNKARIERIKKNQEERCKKDLEICTFKPSIKGKVYIKEGVKPIKTLKKGYSGKIFNDTNTEPVEYLIEDPDLDNIEYEHALKRLHWELESLYLSSNVPN